jgi:hypothetical protein
MYVREAPLASFCPARRVIAYYTLAGAAVAHSGTGLLRDAILRIVLAAEIVGIRAILVHAISDTAKAFYEKYGFIASPVDPLTVMITVAEAARSTAAPR